MSRRNKGRNPYRKPDAFAKQAKNEGFAARSVYKLQEIDRRARILRPGARVVDLGCYPGSWSQWALERIGSRGHLVGVDSVVSVDGLFFWVEGGVDSGRGARFLGARLPGARDVAMRSLSGIGRAGAR